MSDTPRGNIEARIAEYLSTGGLFNPEFADHNAVRDLIIDCRKELIDVRSDAKSWADQCSERVKDWDEMRIRAEKAERELADLQIKMAALINPSKDVLEVVLREQQCWAEESDPVYEGGVMVEDGMSQSDADWVNDESITGIHKQISLIVSAIDAARKT